jgi:predicted nucleic acid-binding protein
VKLVIDASVAAPAAISGRWPEPFAGHELIAPSLLWSEATAAIRQQEYRKEIAADLATRAIRWLEATPIDAYASATLIAAAQQLARRMGWAKSYDAEYVVLAQRQDAALLSLDARLVRSVSRLVRVVAPGDL